MICRPQPCRHHPAGRSCRTDPGYRATRSAGAAAVGRRRRSSCRVQARCGASLAWRRARATGRGPARAVRPAPGSCACARPV